MRGGRGRRRALRLSLALLAVVLLAYPVAGNLLLSTDSGRRLILPRGDKVSVQWHRAWTVLPGLVHVSGLVLDVDNRHLAWELRAETSDIWINLVKLPSRHFSILRASAEGLSCRFDIPADEDVEQPRKKKRPWRISLSNVRLDGLARCDIGSYRLLGTEAGGRASVRGGLDLQLRHSVELRNVGLEFGDVRLESDGRAIAQFSRLEARADSEPFPMKEVKGRQLLRYFTGSFDVDGTTQSLGFLDAFLAKAPWLDLDSDHGTLRTRVRFDQGRLANGSTISFASDDLAIQYLDYVALGSAELEGTVSGENPSITAAFREFSLRQEELEQPHVAGEELEVRIDASSNDLASTPDVTLRLDLPPSRVPDLTAYNRLVPDRAGIDITGGAGTIEAHFTLSTAEIPVAGELRSGPPASGGEPGGNSGSIALSSPDLAVTAGDLELTGALTVTTDIEDIDTERRVLRLSRARVAVEEATLTRAGQTLRSDWNGKLELDEGTVALSKPLLGRTRLALAMTDIYPILVFFAEEKPKIETVAKILKVEDVAGRAELELGDELLTLDELTVEGDRLLVEGRLCLGSRTRSGALHARAFGVGLASWFNGTDRRWTVLRPRRWYERKLAEPTCAPIGSG